MASAQPWGDPWTARVPLTPYVESRTSVLFTDDDVWFTDVWAGTPLTAGDSHVWMGLSIQASRVEAQTTDGRRSVSLRLGPDIWGIVRGRGKHEGSYHAFVMRLRQPVPVDRVSNWYRRLRGEASGFRVVLTYDGYLDLGPVHASLEAGIGNAEVYGSAVLLAPVGERLAAGGGLTLALNGVHTAVATVRVRPFRTVVELGASVSLPLRVAPFRVEPPYPTAELTLIGPMRGPPAR